MNYFINLLRKLRGQGWYISPIGRIRNKNAYCPGMAAMVELGYHWHDFGAIHADRLGLYPHQIQAIVDAADNQMSSRHFDPTLRQRMIDALGITEGP